MSSGTLWQSMTHFPQDKTCETCSSALCLCGIPELVDLPRKSPTGDVLPDDDNENAGSWPESSDFASLSN
jgi:hypothetical protein